MFEQDGVKLIPLEKKGEHYLLGALLGHEACQQAGEAASQSVNTRSSKARNASAASAMRNNTSTLHSAGLARRLCGARP
eukprot:6175271-Pleurochrysis_carterae.AAC.1